MLKGREGLRVKVKIASNRNKNATTAEGALSTGTSRAGKKPSSRRSIISLKLDWVGRGSRKYGSSVQEELKFSTRLVHLRALTLSQLLILASGYKVIVVDYIIVINL
jgi:hypothetical protein